jgi:hypothetical protein
MRRCAFAVLFTITMLAVVRIGMSFQQPTEEGTPFQWLATTGETSGLKYPTHRLQSLSLGDTGGPPVEIEQEEVKVDAQTTRITRRVFMTSVNGDRQLTETVVEEIRKMSDDRVHAVRTTSRKNADGSFAPVQQDVQDMAPSGAGSYQIKRTLLLPGSGGALVEKEQIQQTERKTGEKGVEIDRTRYVPDINGNWSTAERRISQNTVGEERSQTAEQVYQPDVNNNLTLTRQIQATEWKNPDGRHWQSETFLRDLEGKLRLDSRVTMLQTPQRDGRQETTETLEKPSPIAPNEGTKLVRKIVENLTVINPRETEKQLDVLEPGLNGGMQSIYSQQTVEVKEPHAATEHTEPIK